jgi:mRNA-degrading endonuclease RelE of RelBE toxin-antitoxin system
LTGNIRFSPFSYPDDNPFENTLHFLFPPLTGKFAGLRRFRVGDYRVIDTIIEDTAVILRITHRRESYR